MGLCQALNGRPDESIIAVRGEQVMGKKLWDFKGLLVFSGGSWDFMGISWGFDDVYHGLMVFSC